MVSDSGLRCKLRYYAAPDVLISQVNAPPW